MFPRLAFLPLGLFVIWGFICHHWYVCHIKMACETEEPTLPPPVEPTVDDRPLVFEWDGSNPIVRKSFAQLKNGKVAEMDESTLLEIVGQYFPDEQAPDGFSNMGLARASEVAKLFIPPLKAGQVVETSQLISAEPKGIRGDTLFESIVFNFKKNTPIDTVEIIEVDNTVNILFPYGSSTREPDPKVDEYLSKLAERLSQTDETVLITGHTDDAGTAEFNLKLGRARANHIRDILRSHGLAPGRMTVESKGEAQPVANNDTEEGSRQNRRVVILMRPGTS